MAFGNVTEDWHYEKRTPSVRWPRPPINPRSICLVYGGVKGDLYTMNDKTAYCFRFELNAAY
jgi:hypothetical protein